MNTSQFDNYKDLSSESFEFANTEKRITDKKLETKSLSYFADALIRFGKNKASVVAAVIILLIVLFAIIVPITFNGPQTKVMVTYYQKLPSRIASVDMVGFLDGGVDDDYNERALIFEYAKGVAAISEGDNIVPLSAAYDSEYQPVLKINQVKSVKQGGKINTLYNARIDQYLSVGFITEQLTGEQLEKVKEWEKATGKQILYPIVATNDYNFKGDPKNPNYWYKVSGKGTPIRLNPNDPKGYVELSYGDNLVLEDNYERDENGNLKYYKYSGSDSGDQYTVRVLFYNYYQYLYGTTPDYLLGTDSQGYDLAVRMAGGIRLSLILAVCVSLVNFIIGAIYGAIEGYYGGVIDLTMERITDILSGVPFIVVATLFQIHLTNTGKVGPFGSLIFAFVLTGWIGTASRVRSQFYRFKNQEYILAARTLGARDARIIWKHIFPNTLGTIITSSVLVIPGVIFSESMLSYLGIVSLGDASGTSLGTLLSEASAIWTDYPHLMIAPALVISLLMICFNLFGNGLRDAFNPSLRGVEE